MNMKCNAKPALHLCLDSPTQMNGPLMCAFSGRKQPAVDLRIEPHRPLDFAYARRRQLISKARPILGLLRSKSDQPDLLPPCVDHLHMLRKIDGGQIAAAKSR